MAPRPVVYVVDGDASVRVAVESLLDAAGLEAKCFGSARDFLSAVSSVDVPTCLVLDVQLPGGSGLDLQRELHARGSSLPIVFITGHADIQTCVQAIKGGAVEFLLKPLRGRDLLAAIEKALQAAREMRRENAELADLRASFDLLTPRERDVLELVVAGLLNKQIAYELGISEVTVKIHRGQVMHKTGANSLADLVRMAERIKDRPPAPS